MAIEHMTFIHYFNNIFLWDVLTHLILQFQRAIQYMYIYIEYYAVYLLIYYGVFFFTNNNTLSTYKALKHTVLQRYIEYKDTGIIHKISENIRNNW